MGSNPIPAAKYKEKIMARPILQVGDYVKDISLGGRIGQLKYINGGYYGVSSLIYFYKGNPTVWEAYDVELRKVSYEDAVAYVLQNS